MPAIMLVISGRVQGVGFRAYTRRVARQLGLAGWVANLPDGTVSVAASGSGALLARFEQALRGGPPLARVDAISRRDTLPEPTLPDPFQIK